MNVDIFIDSIGRARALRRYAAIMLRKALRRHAGAIAKTELKLRDINAEKGGLDKECTVVVETKSGTLVTKAIHAEPVGALKLALRKLIPNLRQQFEKYDKPNKREKRRIRSLKYVMS